MRVKNLARDTIAVLSKRLKSMTLRSATKGDNWPQPDIHPRLQTFGVRETNVNRPPEGIHPMESHRLELFADYLPDAQRFGVQPGTFRVRLSASGLNSLSTDGLEGDDHYLVQLWPDAPIEPVVLKQWED